MINKNYLEYRQYVTTDEAALLVAGIDPVKFAPIGGRTGYEGVAGELAQRVKNILRYNLLKGDMDPEPISVEYHPASRLVGDPYDKYSGLADIAAALKERGVPYKATFKSDSLWRWIASNLAQEEGFDPELFDYLVERYLQKNSTKAGDTALSFQSNIKLQQQVGALTERLQHLQHVEDENSALNAALELKPFRHMNPELRLVREIQDRYWGDNVDMNDPDTHPKQKDIIEWLISTSRTDSRKEAAMLARMASPDGLSTASKRLGAPKAGKKSSK